MSEKKVKYIIELKEETNDILQKDADIYQIDVLDLLNMYIAVGKKISDFLQSDGRVTLKQKNGNWYELRKTDFMKGVTNG